MTGVSAKALRSVGKWMPRYGIVYSRYIDRGILSNNNNDGITTTSNNVTAMHTRVWDSLFLCMSRVMKLGDPLRDALDHSLL